MVPFCCNSTTTTDMAWTSVAFVTQGSSPLTPSLEVEQQVGRVKVTLNAPRASLKKFII